MNEIVLIIEDDMDFAESVKIKVQEADLTDSIEIKDFESGFSELESIAPDVVVLDIFQGEPNYDKREGMPIWNRVWKQSFIPLVFVSASRVDELIEYANKHPLVNYVVKTETGAMDSIVDGIRRFLPFGKGIKEIRTILCSDAQQTAQKALTETAPHTLDMMKNPKDQLTLLKSSARRRLAAFMRLKSEEEREHLFAWEQYLYPPADVSYLQTGDILALSSGDRDSPDAFRMVLSPTCDLAQKKVDHVLVGRCVPLREFFSKNNLPSLTSNRKKEKASDKLSSMLTEAQSSGYAVLPAYSGLIPSMAVSLRSIELLSIIGGVKAISADGKEFERVTSIDSPFREQLAWAYLQIAGRPGIPDRDIEAWIKEILSNLA